MAIPGGMDGIVSEIAVTLLQISIVADPQMSTRELLDASRALSSCSPDHDDKNNPKTLS